MLYTVYVFDLDVIEVSDKKAAQEELFSEPLRTITLSVMPAKRFT